MRLLARTFSLLAMLGLLALAAPQTYELVQPQEIGPGFHQLALGPFTAPDTATYLFVATVQAWAKIPGEMTAIYTKGGRLTACQTKHQLVPGWTSFQLVCLVTVPASESVGITVSVSNPLVVVTPPTSLAVAKLD